jgi:hypothetical protein
VNAERRAARLVRWYPAAWRAQYGEEFTSLLVDDIVERPFSCRRSIDVARAGCGARWRSGGLAGDSPVPTSQARSVAWVLGAAGVFLFFANALWSQLIVDWQWSPPGSTVTVVAIAIMTVALAALTVSVAMLAGVAVVRGVRTRVSRLRRLALPGGVATLGLAVLLGGAARFSPGWPGTDGHSWSLRGVVPAGVGAFSWSATLSVTSYWVHLHELTAFPRSELIWMIVSPLAVIATIGGGVVTLARLGGPLPRTRVETRLVRAVGVTMAVFSAGAFLWLADDSPRQPHYMFHKGVIDLVDVLVMAATVAVAWRARTSLTRHTVTAASP